MAYTGHILKSYDTASMVTHTVHVVSKPYDSYIAKTTLWYI